MRRGGSQKEQRKGRQPVCQGRKCGLIAASPHGLPPFCRPIGAISMFANKAGVSVCGLYPCHLHPQLAKIHFLLKNRNYVGKSKKSIDVKSTLRWKRNSGVREWAVGQRFSSAGSSLPCRRHAIISIDKNLPHQKIFVSLHPQTASKGLPSESAFSPYSST